MKFLFLATVFLVALSFPAPTSADPNLLHLLSSSPKFSVLLSLIKYTRLLNVLSNTKNLTIFAPTNDGFKKALADFQCALNTPKQIVACIKLKIGPDFTAAVLKYHVVPLVLPSSKVLARTSFPTLNGQTIKRRGLQLIDRDPDFTNPKLLPDLLNLRYNKGLAHGINSLLIPVPNPKAPTLAKVATRAGQFKILLALLKRTGLTKLAVKTTYITVLAPTDDAFKRTAKEIGCPNLSPVTEIVNCIVNTVKLEGARAILAYHLYAGVLPSKTVLKITTLTSFSGVKLYRKGLELVDQAPVLMNARLDKTLLNVKYNNGVIHGITRVLIPFNTGVGTPCQQFEVPISLKNGMFVAIFKLQNAIKKCKPLRTAIQKCGLKKSEICRNTQGRKMINANGVKITVGRIVAAAKKCATVAKAVKTCKI